MVSSFYFVMWILIYFLIIISGNHFLAEYAFFVAFIGVYLVGMAANSLCREPIERRNRREMITFLEILYTGYLQRLRSRASKRLYMLMASFVYMVIATAGLIIGHADWIIIGIFAFFTFTTGREVHRMNAEYQTLRRATGMSVPQGPMREALDQYAQQRQVASYLELCPKPSASEKALKVFNIAISAICILIGVFFIYYFGSAMLIYGTHGNTGAIINFAYGLLALVYGINDLYSSIKSSFYPQ